MPLAFLYSAAHLLIIGKMNDAPPALSRLTLPPPSAATFTAPSPLPAPSFLAAPSPLFFVPPAGGLLPQHHETPRNAAARPSITSRFMFHLSPSLRDPQVSSISWFKVRLGRSVEVHVKDLCRLRERPAPPPSDAGPPWLLTSQISANLLCRRMPMLRC